MASGDSITYTITAQGSYWDLDCDLTTDAGLGESSVGIKGPNVDAYNRGWDWQNTSGGAMPDFGFAVYKLTSDHSDTYFLIDYRDCEFEAGYGGGMDVLIHYNAASESYSWCNRNPGPCSLTSISNGATLKIWEMKDVEGPSTSGFQPTTPVNLTLTNSGGHPKLTWRKSDPRVSAKYKVYRGSTLITPTAISDTSYTDTQVSIGGGSTIYYKVRAASGDGSKESPDYSNTVSTSGVYEDRPADLADVAHPRYRLDTSYPNPFNPSTTLCYTLPDRSQVTLLVFNTLGQKVATLVEGEVDAGSHESIFDAGGLPSGVYIARLIAGGTVQTTRMHLVR